MVEIIGAALQHAATQQLAAHVVVEERQHVETLLAERVRNKASRRCHLKSALSSRAECADASSGGPAPAAPAATTAAAAAGGSMPTREILNFLCVHTKRRVEVSLATGPHCFEGKTEIELRSQRKIMRNIMHCVFHYVFWRAYVCVRFCTCACERRIHSWRICGGSWRVSASPLSNPAVAAPARAARRRAAGSVPPMLLIGVSIQPTPITSPANRRTVREPGWGGGSL